MRLWWVLCLRALFLIVVFYIGRHLQGIMRKNRSIENGGHLRDDIMDWFYPWNRYLRKPSSEILRQFLMLFASVSVDFTLLCLWASFVLFGFTRLFGVFLLQMFLRELLVLSFHLPVPKDIIWCAPFDFPTIFLDYKVPHDLFFSGHISLCCIAICFLAEQFQWLGFGLGVGLLVFNVVFLLAYRIHYTADIYAAIVTTVALYCGLAHFLRVDSD
jgi:hypothetical protein